uniref:protein O-mannose kinase isoform X2 n=1 Tax=Myxine glutinosa TaxID=7769 RepID=UPI00358E45CA
MVLEDRQLLFTTTFFTLMGIQILHGLYESPKDVFELGETQPAHCPPGTFRLRGMGRCEPWLGCSALRRIIPRRMIGQGAVKQVYLAQWRGFRTALSRLRVPALRADFRHGVRMLRGLQSEAVVQLVGFCNQDDLLLTEFHPLGTLANVERVLESWGRRDDSRMRLAIATSYVSVLAFLHSSPLGTRVMCDSNDLPKTLSQFLLLEHLGVVANDLDALPNTRSHFNSTQAKGVHCGFRSITGDFAAPEQRWAPSSHHPPPAYDEKTDIWKIPAVTDFVMGNGPGSDIVRLHLFEVHRHCKLLKPEMRPSAAVVLRHYTTAYRELLRDEL